MTKVAMMLCAAAALVSTPVLAQATQPPAQSGTATKAKDPNRMICQREEQLGSRLSARKVCMTATEWDQLRRDSREAVYDVQRRATQPVGPNSG